MCLWSGLTDDSVDRSLEEAAGEALEGLAKVDDDSVRNVTDVTVSASLVAKNL